MRVYAFDVDETLEISGGPIRIAALVALRAEGHIVGLCGNWAVCVRAVPTWYAFVSFLGPMQMTKPIFLTQVRQYVPADDYVVVGNILGVSGMSDDQTAADLAGWRFIRESDFAAGAR